MFHYSGKLFVTWQNSVVFLKSMENKIPRFLFLEIDFSKRREKKSVFSSMHADTFVKGKLRFFHTKSKWNQAFIIVLPLNNEMAFLFIGSSTIDARFRNIRLFQVYSVVRAAISTKMY